MIKLSNPRPYADIDRMNTQFDVLIDGNKVGTAYRCDSGSYRGTYSYGGNSRMSRNRLLASLSA